MNASCIRVLLCLWGVAAAAAFAADPVDLPSREWIPPYAPQNMSFADASIFITSSPAGGEDSEFESAKPVQRDYRDLQGAIAKETQRRRQALYIRELPDGNELQLIAKPTVQISNIPWTPMIAMDETPFTPSNAARKLEVRFPAVKLLW